MCGIGTRIDTRTMNSKEMFGGYCDPSGDQREAKCKMTDCPGKNLNNR